MQDTGDSPIHEIPVFLCQSCSAPFARIVQLSLPSTREPHPRPPDCYRDHGAALRDILPGCFAPEVGFWEMPSRVAHLTALPDAAGMESTYIDLSKTTVNATSSMKRLLAESGPSDTVLFSRWPRTSGLPGKWPVCSSRRGAG